VKYGAQRRTKRIFMVPTSFGLQTNYKLQKNSLLQENQINHWTTNYKLQPHTIPWKPITNKKRMHENFLLVYKELNYISHHLLSMMHNVTMFKHLPPSP
jgi:hypothetical protein